MKNDSILRFGSKFLGCCVGALFAVCGNVATQAQETEEMKIVSPENRWIIVIDASPADASAESRAALTALRADLRKTGVRDEQIIFYSQFERNSAFRATRENVADVVAALRNPNQYLLKVPTGDVSFETVRVRTNPRQAAEAQIYLTSLAAANPEQTKFAIVPADVDASTVESVDDERLVDFEELKEATSETDDPNIRPIERALLVANFLSVASTTRGADDEPNALLNDVDVKKALSRSAFSGDDARDGRSFFNGYVLMKNESPTETRPSAFFQILRDGLSGHADLAGNQNGFVQASELIQYVQANAGDRNIESSSNGNDAYPICESSKKIADAPVELMREVGERYSRDLYPAEKRWALERAARSTTSVEKKVPAPPTPKKRTNAERTQTRGGTIR